MAEAKGITSMMGEKRIFEPPQELRETAYIKSRTEYEEIYRKSIDDVEGFWAEMAEQLDWYKKWDKVLVEDFKEGKHEWFVGGKLNISYNCLDRQLKTWRKNKAALIWEGDIGDSRILTYQQLYREVCRFASVIVVKRADIRVAMKEGRDRWWHDEMAAGDIKSVCEPEVMDAEDPLFILYTSGSTGKPKGVLHTQAGYLLFCYQTFKWIFDVKEDDTYWCTADIGWVTGHSYIVYGPLAYGAASVMFEGIPTYPHPDRFWEIVEKYRINIFYTAPTAIRAIMREGDDWPKKHDLSSLRVLGTVGEPINPEAWMWYYNIIGKGKCPIVDTWWQTETGGILITPLPGAIATKPGSATVPFPGVEPAILREDGSVADVNEGGYLVIKKPWPGLMRRVYGEPKRFKETYFVKFPGVYTTGDGARIDEDGYYWLMGRIDDVINVSGHRIGTAEVESALVSHEKVAEAAVVGMPHDIKGQGIYAYVTLKVGLEGSDELAKELVTHVRKEIGPIATPDKIQFADGLPKTRSGKIMRRILVKIAAGNVSELGDTSTLADPSVVESLVEGRK